MIIHFYGYMYNCFITLILFIATFLFSFTFKIGPCKPLLLILIEPKKSYWAQMSIWVTVCLIGLESGEFILEGIEGVVLKWQ